MKQAFLAVPAEMDALRACLPESGSASRSLGRPRRADLGRSAPALRRQVERGTLRMNDLARPATRAAEAIASLAASLAWRRSKGATSLERRPAPPLPVEPPQGMPATGEPGFVNIGEMDGPGRLAGPLRVFGREAGVEVVGLVEPRARVPAQRQDGDVPVEHDVEQVLVLQHEPIRDADEGLIVQAAEVAAPEGVDVHERDPGVEIPVVGTQPKAARLHDAPLVRAGPRGRPARSSAQSFTRLSVTTTSASR